MFILNHPAGTMIIPSIHELTRRVLGIWKKPDKPKGNPQVKKNALPQGIVKSSVVVFQLRPLRSKLHMLCHKQIACICVLCLQINSYIFYSPVERKMRKLGCIHLLHAIKHKYKSMPFICKCLEFFCCVLLHQ